MKSVRSRWAARLAVRKRLLARARALLAKRQAQVDYADRVLKRHPVPTRPVDKPTRMYDSITVSQIPRDARAVAGYIGGKWPTYSSGELQRAFPHAHRLGVCISASQDGECLDVEPGDARPDQAAVWVKRQHARGVKRPVIYASLSAMQQIVDNLAAAGVPRDSVRLWSAHYTHTPHICGPACGFSLRSTMDATQFTDHSHGRNLDESVLAPGFWS